MHTNFVRPGTGGTPILRGVRRLGVLALLALVALAPASAWGQLFGRPVAQPCFDFPAWARFSDCRPGPLPWGYDVFPDYGPVDCACDMPDGVACPGDFVAHRPSDWYATADFAPLTLDYQLGYPIAQIGGTAIAFPGDVVLTTNDLHPEFDSAGKFTVGRRIFDCYRIEGSYLGLLDWQDTAVVTNNQLSNPAVPGIDNSNPPDGDFVDPGDVAPIPANPASVGNLATFLSGFADPQVDGLDGNFRDTISFQSSFQSAEVNLKYWAAMPPGPFDVSYIVGARYMRMREQFNFLGEAQFLPEAGVAADVTNALQTNTENDLWGVQVGIQGSFLKSTRWWVDFDLKGGMYNNHATLITDFVQVTDGATTITGGGTSTRDRTAWVGDLSIVGNWQMTPSCTFRIGYQAIFINGLVLAPDNAVGNADLLVLGSDTVRVDDGGELAYHGPIIGLTWMR